jgi:hypothetical protein
MLILNWTLLKEKKKKKKKKKKRVDGHCHVNEMKVERQNLMLGQNQRPGIKPLQF